MGSADPRDQMLVGLSLAGKRQGDSAEIEAGLPFVHLALPFIRLREDVPLVV